MAYLKKELKVTQIIWIYEKVQNTILDRARIVKLF